MKTFFKDYMTLWKDSMKFYKKHWFGMMVLETVVFVVTFGGLTIIGKRKEKEFERRMNELG